MLQLYLRLRPLPTLAGGSQEPGKEVAATNDRDGEPALKRDDIAPELHNSSFDGKELPVSNCGADDPGVSSLDGEKQLQANSLDDKTATDAANDPLAGCIRGCSVVVLFASSFFHGVACFFSGQCSGSNNGRVEDEIWKVR